MSWRKAPAWTPQEIAILRDVYPRGGLQAAADALRDRTWRAIYVMAAKLEIRCEVEPDAPKPALTGAALEEAIRLREQDGWSFARIGAQLGVAEASACNAVLIALCPRKGYTPAQRTASGRLTAEGLERVRLALRRGIKGVDIQLRLGVSASCVAEQRRRYQRDLKARGKADLPPPGGGERYSGAAVPRATMREVERLLMTGLGGPKVADATGVSRSHVIRQRAKLIAKLKRKGEALPGCDADGRRIRIIDTVGAVPEADRTRLRELLLDGTPVRRAALLANMGSSFAYKLRDALAAELEADGRTLPPIRRLGRGQGASAQARAAWLPAGRKNLVLYRRLLREADGDAAEARRRTIRAIAERDGGDPRLAEQIDRLRQGAVIAPRLDLRRPDPALTLGGVSAGMMA